MYKKVPTVKKHHWKCVLKGDQEIDKTSHGTPIHKINTDDPNSMRDAIEQVIVVFFIIILVIIIRNIYYYKIAIII